MRGGFTQTCDHGISIPHVVWDTSVCLRKILAVCRNETCMLFNLIKLLLSPQGKINKMTLYHYHCYNLQSTRSAHWRHVPSLTLLLLSLLNNVKLISCSRLNHCNDRDVRRRNMPTRLAKCGTVGLNFVTGDTGFSKGLLTSVCELGEDTREGSRALFMFIPRMTMFYWLHETMLRLSVFLANSLAKHPWSYSTVWVNKMH